MSSKMSKSPKRIYEVRYMSTAKEKNDYIKSNRVFHKLAIIDTGGNIDDFIEEQRRAIEEALSEHNKKEIKTTTQSVKKTTYTEIIVTERMENE